jgi:hypothetical protein
MVRQFDTGRFTGWASYTFGYGRRADSSGARFFPAQDRRHDLNLVGSWRYKYVTLGARFGLESGTPYTNIEDEYDLYAYDASRGSLWGRGERAYVTMARDGGRLPAAHRLDLSITRTARANGLTFVPWLTLVNSYNAHNVYGYFFNPSGVPPSKVGLPGFPILPAFGLNVVW